MKKKIAFVVQRYGLEVNGGSEYSCRLIAEKLSSDYDVEVITTKAVDYVTWENHYTDDIEVINGVKVRRFNTVHPRIPSEFEKCSREVFGNSRRNIYDELKWMKAQGPVSFALIDYLKENNQEYHKIIFFTYLYFTTFFGIQQIPEKSILVPTAHDEPCIYFSMFKPFFHLPRYIIFLTEEEKDFVHQTFNNEYIPFKVAGLGIDVPDSYLSEEQFRAKFGITKPFIIYVGRIDESKGCKELFEYYRKYKQEEDDYPQLVLMGKNVLEIPNDPDIISLGFVSEEEKFGGILASEMLIMPSKYESLSMVVLESLYLERPVLVNGECEVLVGHCNRSNGGLYYTDYEEFKLCLSLLRKRQDLRLNMGMNGKKYVLENYNWSKIVNDFKEAIEA
jgi:glycosyltransferase involved in cell wall biosynthesis